MPRYLFNGLDAPLTGLLPLDPSHGADGPVVARGLRAEDIRPLDHIVVRSDRGALTSLAEADGGPGVVVMALPEAPDVPPDSPQATTLTVERPALASEPALPAADWTQAQPSETQAKLNNASLAAAPIVFFGDSLSDPGNLAGQASLILPQFIVNALGDDGRATNGPVWAEVLVDRLAIGQSYNYAVAGGEAAGTQTIGDYIAGFGLSPLLTVDEDDPLLDWDMNLGGQINRFLADATADSVTDATAIFLVGLNDFGNIDLDAPIDTVLAQAEAVSANALAAIIGATATLHGVGAVSGVILMSLPSLTFFPAFFGETEEIKVAAEQIIDAFNAALDQFRIDAADALPGLDVSVLPLEALTDAVTDDPTGFGFLVPPDDTLTGSSQAILDAYDEDLFAFWDSLHPSAALHQVIARYTEALAQEGRTLNALTDGADALSGPQPDGGTVTFGYGGADNLTLGSGHDIAFGGSGDDTIILLGGNDLGSGGDGNDLILGRQGDDVLSGGLGDDVLGGGQGNDVLIGGQGNDILRGWTGDDTFIWIDAALLGPDPDYGTQTFRGGEGYDTLYLVVEAEFAALYQAAIDAGTAVDDLATIGLYVHDIEDIVVVVERDGLDLFSAKSWYDDADLWGLI